MIFFFFQVNTYQAIVISNGADTYSVFTYNCDQLNWVGGPGAYASVGFSVQGTTDKFDRNFENHGLSRRPQVNMIACTNVRYNRPWTNVIYKIGVAVNAEQLERSKCLATVSEDAALFPMDLGVFNPAPFIGLSDCPCSYFQIIRDFGFLPVPGSQDVVCFVSRFSRFFGGAFLVNRCCYSIRFVSLHKLIITTCQSKEEHCFVFC